MHIHILHLKMCFSHIMFPELKILKICPAYSLLQTFFVCQCGWVGAYYLLQLGWNYTRRNVKFTDLLILGHVVPICQIVENEIVYTISLKGQKTGFYADQRENRQFISRISDGQKVLDICCFSGGFALNVVRGGALNVTGTLYVVNFAFFIINYRFL